MANASRYVEVLADGTTSYQTIDGFGVNINSKYWDSPSFTSALELLVDDLGATLFRVDIWGKSNWVDPLSEADARVLNAERYRAIYQGETFKKGWALMRYLNERGIEPYLTASGDVPRWMLGEDGKTLVQYEPFCDMLISMVDWAKNQEQLRFKYLGPLNETDIGSPEGPSVSAREFVTVMEVLDAKLRARDLDDVRLVVAEQARFNTDYVKELVKSEKLVDRIGAFSMHTYADYSTETYAEPLALVEDSPYAGTPFWLSEYGDLDQTGDKEWFIAWVSTSRLFGVLEAGFNGAMAWDAFDNYHDHNEFWTIYGLLRTGLNVFTPKKRFYAAKQVYRYVLPGFERIEVSSSDNDVRVLGFANRERTQITLVGMNASPVDLYLHGHVGGFDNRVTSGNVSFYTTTERENCVKAREIAVTTKNTPYTGIDAQLPAFSIFTLTNVK